MSHADPHSNPAQALANLLQLLRRAREADRAEALGFVMVNESQRLLHYRQAVWWRDGLLGRVSALSGLVEVDAGAPYVQWLQRLCHALAKADGPPVRTFSAADVPAELAEDWASWLPTHALWLTLTAQAGQYGGGVLLVRDTPWSDYECTLAGEMAHGYAHALAQFAPQRSVRERLGQWLRPGRQRRWLLAGLLLLLFFPVRLSVLARAEVTPQEPLLIRAPVSGVVDQVLVLPNQKVQAGMPLLKLDATALAGQYAMASKAREAAEEFYRQSAQLAVTDDRAKLELAASRARLDEKSIEADFTSRQLNRIEVKAARDGVVVFSDRSDWQGKAVAVGERVMLLADPGRVELTAYLPAGEAMQLQHGGELRLYPNASPTESYDAQITQIAYRAEPGEDGILTYRIRARFTDAAQLPRIGQQGSARIYGNWVPFSYYALRRPLVWLRQWLGW